MKKSILKILRCPECGGLLSSICFVKDLGLLKCGKCGRVYPVHKNIIMLYPDEMIERIRDVRIVFKTILERLKIECNVKLDQ